MTSLYRLYLVCTMLRRVKVKGRGTAHNYPRIQLSYLLVLEHWRVNNYVALQLMRSNSAIINEELGEASFSLLGNVTLGDNLKSRFDHMSRVYSLLPIYRDIRDELKIQIGKDSINWHHNIRTDDEAVGSTAIFFNRLIVGVKDGTYRSYNGEPACFKNMTIGQQNLTREHMPRVYTTDIVPEISSMFDDIKRSVECDFLSEHDDLWPVDCHIRGADRNESVEMSDYSDGSNLDDQSADDQIWGAPWSMCKVGHFAVTSCDFPGDGLGLALYIVDAINPVLQNDGEVVRNFTGRQYQCSIKNNRQECVNGTWTLGYIRPKSELVNDWEVVKYFKQLTMYRKLPQSVIDYIHQHSQTHQLFQY